MTSRRDFLKTSGLVVMAGAGGFLGLDQFVYGSDDGNPVSSKGDLQKPTLVTIFLRGGADSLHVFVPLPSGALPEGATTRKPSESALARQRPDRWLAALSPAQCNALYNRSTAGLCAS